MKQDRILAIDFMRVYVVMGVVAVHVLTQPIAYDKPSPATFVVLFHVTREIFLLITGLVLTYTAGSYKGWGWLRFYAKRYPLVVIPYVLWTVIYLLANQVPWHPFIPFLRVVWENLLSGKASAQLYFLIVTMKLYFVFPLLRWAILRTKRYHIAVLIASGVLQLLLATAIHEGWLANAPYFGNWFVNPDTAFLSYQFYILCGCIAAYHLPALLAWTRRYFRRIMAAALAAAGLVLASYFWQLGTGVSPVNASAVFQPVVVIESLADALALFALGVRWQDRGVSAKGTYLLLADVSFGIYLAHVWILNQMYYWAGQLGLLDLGYHVRPGIVVFVMLVVAVPLIYVITAAFIALFRRTPFSVAVAGRLQMRT
jgi:peptidoglycan/LPS O-acetylase OafA/YrhL